MAVDPNIVAIFGPPPQGLDLERNVITTYNVVVCVVLGIAVTVVALRFYVRNMKSANIEMDDWAVLVSLFCASATVAMTILAGEHGSGAHVWSIKLTTLVDVFKVHPLPKLCQFDAYQTQIVYAEPFVYALAVTSVKISILLLYRRLFPLGIDKNRLYTIMFWIATFLTTVYPFILWITMPFACKPVSHFWNQYLGAKGKCIEVKLFFLVLGIMNMMNDIIILTVPIPRIWTLHMNNKTKISIICIMLLGSFVCVASIARIYYLWGFFQNLDATWWMGPSFAWSSLEPSVAVISACLPTLAPLFRIKRINSTSRGTPSGPTDLSKSGSKHFQLFSVNRTKGGAFGSDDDEVELTYDVGRGGTGDGSIWKNQGGSAAEQGIVVQTQVSVTHQDRKGRTSTD
ncbi:related to integral membrane protein [Fusarium fujikuroi]|uniref:Related to integral membrane protein n=2 Tax=Fusarium fujikuroi TaxID=5127 RepID=S0ELG8_GIBF5|nr:related to integral membrane protein [Fusarium fujikuroi IMI 58289]KAG4291819.1 hypothetical protein FPRO06_13072 [Fusarium proliferatum]KLP04163.1 integral membrane protein [Fusarium fujikuroi]KLP13358.1 integral membrane protein [Fusarium fujikuroi]QGI71133.1 hypothetical protein CEK27_003462 [Fusarium fujikuroi]QGI88469.1 hypothetical protein CEK25_003425 [Fusarium fujikuroi]